jgi:hypothetical protein
MTKADAHDARERFSQSLLGTWASCLGGGNDMHIGIRLTFHDDGTGTIQEWGFDHHHLNPAHVNDPTFQWKTTGDRIIDITYQGKTRSVKYDFKTTDNEYGTKQLRIFERGRELDERGEVGFWISPFSLVHSDRQPLDEKGTFERIWEKLRGGL